MSTPWRSFSVPPLRLLEINSKLLGGTLTTHHDLALAIFSGLSLMIGLAQKSIWFFSVK